MEIWKTIKGYPMYEVSSFGRVRSWKVGNGSGFKRANPRYMSLIKDKDGYLIIGLSNSNGAKLLKAHRLVAIAFIENPENKEQVNHDNGIKIDNFYKNLEWATNLENQRHAYANGLNQGSKGEKNYQAKFTNGTATLVRDLVRDGNINQKQIAESLKVSKATICRIVNNKRYADV